MLALTHSYDFGIYRVLLDGNEVLTDVDLYSADVRLEDAMLSTADWATARTCCASSAPAAIRRARASCSASTRCACASVCDRAEPRKAARGIRGRVVWR